jgi:hypothetical protein
MKAASATTGTFFCSNRCQKGGTGGEGDEGLGLEEFPKGVRGLRNIYEPT